MKKNQSFKFSHFTRTPKNVHFKYSKKVKFRSRLPRAVKLAISSLSIIALVGSLFFVLKPANAVNDPADIPAYKNSWSVTAPTGIATDSKGYVYIVNHSGGGAIKYDGTGKQMTSFGSGTDCPASGSKTVNNSKFCNPNGLAVGSDGDVYITDTDNAGVALFKAEGSPGGYWSFSPNTVRPTGVAVNAQGDVFVSAYDTATSTGVIIEMSNSTQIQSIGTVPESSDTFGHLSGIAADEQNNIYVVDSDNSVVHKLNPDLTKSLASWGSTGSGEGKFKNPTGITVDSSDSVYVSDTDNNRIQKFDNDGNYLASWGSAGSNNGEFKSPSGIVADRSDDSIYVNDAGNMRVQRFAYSDTAVPLAPVKAAPQQPDTGIVSNLTNPGALGPTVKTNYSMSVGGLLIMISSVCLVLARHIDAKNLANN